MLGDLSKLRKSLTAINIVNESSLVVFQEEISNHLDDGWVVHGEVEYIEHDNWEEKTPNKEGRFSLEMRLYEVTLSAGSPSQTNKENNHHKLFNY